MKLTITLLIAFILLVGFSAWSPVVEVKADIPVHCLWNETVGSWTFNLGANNLQKADALKSCAPNQNFTATSSATYKFSYPNIVSDSNGNKVGTWSILWDQGFEAIINGGRYFAFFYFTKENGHVVSHCGKTFTGYYYQDQGPNTQTGYGCMSAERDSVVRKRFPATAFDTNIVSGVKLNTDEMIASINNDASSTWTATKYNQWEGLTHTDLARIGKGGRKIRRWRRIAIEKAMKDFQKTVARMNIPKATTESNVPAAWDWRNVQGDNYVTPVRNQASCGSCYIFGSLGQIACRLRVKTQLKDQTIFSPQDVVQCGNPDYAQGCDGGLQYLVGKYGYENGFLPEHCKPYQGRDDTCPSYTNRWGCDTTPFYVKGYEYTGGYYGGSNEQNMKDQLVNNGPLTVAFYVYPDFFHYRGGVYQHRTTAEENDPNIPFVDVNHSVLMVGYGTDDKGTPYWICRNSWGTGWGNQGYFLIKRGGDDGTGIQSCVVDFQL